MVIVKAREKRINSGAVSRYELKDLDIFPETTSMVTDRDKPFICVVRVAPGKWQLEKQSRGFVTRIGPVFYNLGDCEMYREKYLET